jgi:serine/threonine protein kinase
MPAERQCARCGAVLTANAPKGLCPRCLMGAALDKLPARTDTSTKSPPATAEEGVGDRIDHYKILQKLGEGGCGVVFMAEQAAPVRRRVALKVIKLGMDTRQVIARFEAEHHALALMEHPNIAKVLDAGATSSGRPYFVMELVKGIPITDYCDQHHLATPERLALFTQVCQAVQHAHQKGIIHRDIKPSNILVTLHDGMPVPKVIDFGIAKATEQSLTEMTVFTAIGQFMGTPAYMSPEQAELSGLDVDTRSDIYALGVLLYELLTGRTPFDAKELLRAGLDEMRRRIREEEPLRPSTRLSTMADADLTAVARQRQSEPGKLTRFIRGDLDWIVMKCLEKDRTRRYETANGLAMDIRRHLANEPVVACPPSALYRLQKLARRNRLAVGAATAVAVALLVGLGLSTWLWLAERKAHSLATAAEQNRREKEREARESEAQMREMLDLFTRTQIGRTQIPREFRPVMPGFTNDLAVLVPPGDARLNGRSYAEWAAAWWKWGLEMPPTNATGVVHPYIDSPRFDVTASQTSEVWFLAAPFGVVRRSYEIPFGKSLFFPIVCAESSSIEPPPFYGATASDQAATARDWVDHTVNLFCELDGVPLLNLEAFRTQNRQVSFTAPSPWLQAETGGKGTFSGDGYFIFLAPLAPGHHTLRYGATVQFARPRDPFDEQFEIDMTYQITVTAPAL